MNIFEVLVILVTVAVFGQPVILSLLLVTMKAATYYNRTKNPLTFLFRIPFKGVEYITTGSINRWIIWKVSRIPSFTLRKLSYRLKGVNMGKNITFHYGLELRDPQKLYIGDGTIIGDNVLLDARSGLKIGNNVNFSSNASVYTLQHNYRSATFDCQFDRPLNVEIGNRAWIGSNVVILPGVAIGEGAVVCAGAVVTKDVPPYSVVAGIPAKQIGERPRNLQYNFSDSKLWFI